MKLFLVLLILVNILLNTRYMCMCMHAHSCLPLCDPMECSLLGSSVEFSRQEYWSGLPFLPPGGLLNPVTEFKPLGTPTLAGGFFTTAPPGKPNIRYICLNVVYIYIYALHTEIDFCYQGQISTKNTV